MVSTESLTNRVWLSGELLSGSERRRPGYEISVLFNDYCLIVHEYRASKRLLGAIGLSGL